MKVRWNEVLNHLDSQRYPYPYLYPRHQTFMKSKSLNLQYTSLSNRLLCQFLQSSQNKQIGILKSVYLKHIT